MIRWLKEHPKEVAFGFFLLFVALLWVLTFVLFMVAIFIDRAPAEGNLGGAGVIILCVAIVLSFVAGFIAEALNL